MSDDFENPNSDLPGLDAPENFKFEREDWMLFRTAETLQQKAGVSLDLLVRLVLKEIADNALDAGGEVTLDTQGETYVIADDGPGIDGTPEDIAELYSIGRKLISSKLWRKPTRGRIGNGLRVVAGAVICAKGTLVVSTGNRRITLQPEYDGTTTVVSVEETARSYGNQYWRCGDRGCSCRRRRLYTTGAYQNHCRRAATCA
jgi:hypothetical protein